MKVPCRNIPTYDFEKEQWVTTSFDTQADFAEFLIKEVFREPGEYDFDETTFKWNEFARMWNSNGKHKLYTLTTPGTNDYWDFWDEEELKCRLGVLWKRKDGRWYYTTRDFYFLINYCPIVNKEQGFEETFVDVRDGQYHMMLYEKIGEILHQNTACLKRRQFLYSFCHAAKSANYIWFENRKKVKWFASDDAFISGINGSWLILDQYKSHLNNYTGWWRNFSPDVTGEMQQREQVKVDGKWEWQGNESSLIAKTLKKDPKAGVGGPTFWAWYEEGGIAPTADTTLQYMEPAITSGMGRVGSFCIGGSVGDLDECKPLKDFILTPRIYGMYAVPTKWYDETGVVKECGLFIPAQYGMPEATDEFGNSQVDKALKLLHQAEFEGFKKGDYKGNVLVSEEELPWVALPPEQYILKKSQNPKNIKEAFAWRKVSYFDPQKSERRQKAIDIQKENNTFHVKQGLMEEDVKTERIRLKPISEFTINKPFEQEYPVKMTEIDKRGVVNIYEDYNPQYSYYSGVDSIESDITTTSDSLFSLHIYRRGYTEIDTTTGKRKTVRGKLVADWCGRFDSLEETNDHALLLLRYFKAKAACERNRPNFINHCRRKNYHHLIARKSELPFDKDVANTGVKDSEEYGVWNDGQGKFRGEIKRVMKEYLNMEVDTIHMPTKEDSDEIGKVMKIVRGYDLIDSYWTLEELKLYNDEDNFDRFISASLAIAYGTAEELTFEKKIEVESEIEKKPKQIIVPRTRNYLSSPRQMTNKRGKRNLLNY